MATTKVNNIREIKHEISDETRALCEQLNVAQYIPKITPTTVSFELHDTSTEVANAFRRCINSEMDILIMDFEEKDFKCDDKFIILFEIRKAINLIPIRQISDMRFSLNVYNDTNDIINVMSSDIKEEGKNTEGKFSQTFIIAELEPGKSIQVNNIVVKKGVAFKNGAKFSYPGVVAYECLDIDESKSTLETEPTKYKLSIQKQQYTDPKNIVKRAAKTLEEKLNTIDVLIRDHMKGNLRNSEKMEISEFGDKTEYKIYDETYTIGNLVVKYTLDIDPSIEKISCNRKFTFDNFIIISVYHSDANAVILKGVSRAKQEVVAVGAVF